MKHGRKGERKYLRKEVNWAEYEMRENIISRSWHTTIHKDSSTQLGAVERDIKKKRKERWNTLKMVYAEKEKERE